MEKSTKKYILIIAIALIIIILLFIPLVIVLNKREVLDNEAQQKNDKKNPIPIPNPELNRTLDSIKILRLPHKIYYKEGELLDKTGMIIKAIYNDNTEAYIDDYKIGQNEPLTIYDSNITISYEGKTVSFRIKIVNNEEQEIYPNPSKEKYSLELKEGITRFEIEDSNLLQWIFSYYEYENLDNIIIKRNDASRKAFVSGVDNNSGGKGRLFFNLDLNFNSTIEMSVSYSQSEEWKDYDIDISSVYIFLIDEKKIIDIDGDKILTSREDITKWQIIKYKKYSLPKGKHTLSIKIKANIEYGTPNIDYIDFKSIKIEEVPVEPDIDEIPKNDFHTLLQYQYITDDPENIFNYANGIEDLSRPKGNILDFSDSVKENSYSYIIQISSSKSFNSSDTKTIENLNEKNYILKNLKLGETIFYRGGINEDDLKNSKIYELTVNTLAPRNLDIPEVDNARDIGGVKTTLVENGIIKQGLYHRSALLDYVQEEGKKIITEDLGIKVEIDLRADYETNGPYVEGVEYHPISIDSPHFEDYNDVYYKVFDLISNADKMPIILHCQAGADRTGIMTFALMTLLGCEYKDIVKDYLFTNFGVQGYRDHNNDFMGWWRSLDQFPGETKSEQCKNWLLSKGIEEDKLEHIREIFIDNYKKEDKNEIKAYSLKIADNNKNFFA